MPKRSGQPERNFGGYKYAANFSTPLVGVGPARRNCRAVRAFDHLYPGCDVNFPEIVAGIRLRTVITNELLLILMGVISILFGILIILFPGVGALAIIIWIGAMLLWSGSSSSLWHSVSETFDS